MNAQDVLRQVVHDEMKNAGYNQRTTAEMIQCSEQHLNRVLTGRSGMTLELAERILGLYGAELVITARMKHK